MKVKRKLAWILIATMTMSHVSPAFASTVFTSSNAEMPISEINGESDTYADPREVFTDSNASEGDQTDHSANVPSEIATGSDATFVEIPDENLLNVLIEQGYDRDGNRRMSVVEMEEITYLWADFRNITDLTGLEYAVNLTNLYLNENYIEDLSPIANCKNLCTLEVKNNQLTEIPDLIALDNLELYDIAAWDEEGNAIIGDPRNIFGGNQIPREKFEGKLTAELTEEWLDLNGYDPTSVEIADEKLLQALIESRFDRDGNGEMSVSEMRQITNLNLNYREIENLSGLEYAENLYYLDLDMNQISDLSVVSSLKKMVYLSARRNNLTEIPDLSSLANLGLYDVIDYDEEGNEIVNPRNMFGGNRILREEFSGKLAKKPSEEWLELNSYNPTSVEIADEKLLQALIDQGYDQDGNGAMCVSEMIQITELSLMGCGIEDLSGLEFAENLCSLDIAYNKISDLTAVASLKKLEYLYAVRNKLTEIPDMKALTKLTLQDTIEYDEEGNGIVTPRNMFGGNLISREKFIGKFAKEPSDEWLDLNSYDATPVYIPDEQLLKKLLEENCDADGDGMICVSEIKQITILHGANSNISDLTGLEHAKNLTILYLDYNQITDLTPLLNCTKLDTLYVRYNRLSDIPDMKALTRIRITEEFWDIDEDGNEIKKYIPIDLFRGNCIRRENFIGKFNEDLSEEWLDLNSYDTRFVEIPDQALKNYLIQGYDTDRDGNLSVSEMEQITNLVLMNLGIKDLTGIESAVNLTGLNVSDNELEDISPITSLTKLESFSACNNRLTTIPDLSSLTNLCVCSENYIIWVFNGNKIPREEFAGKFNVELTEEWLDINSYDGTIVEIPDSTLKQYLVGEYDHDGDGELCKSEMVLINTVSLSSSRVESLKGLEEAKQLEYLRVTNTKVKDLTPLSGLKNLHYCNLNNNRIEDITPLLSCKNLNTLYIKFNNLQTIPDMSEMECMRLYRDVENLLDPIKIFSGNKALNSKECFEGKFSVELTEEWIAANCYDGTIVEIPDENLKEVLLKSCDKDGDGTINRTEIGQITRLSFEGKGVTSLEGLQYAADLSRLYASDNSITDLTPLSELNNLYELVLDNNEIENCEALRGCPVEILNLDGNKITDISPLTECNFLTELSVKRNNLLEIPDMTSNTWLVLYDGDSPMNMFSCNPNLNSRECFEGKFTEELTDEWYSVNLYNSEIIEFPNPNLKMALIGNGNDWDGDGEINRSEISSVESMNLSGYGITDLTGLEYTYRLKTLKIDNNNISDLSPLLECKDLRFLYARNNKLADLPDFEANGIELVLWDEDDGSPLDMFSGNNLTREILERTFPYADEDWIIKNLTTMAGDGTWVQDDTGWRYFDSNGNPYKNQFAMSNGKIYYLGDDGYMVTSRWVNFYEDGEDRWRYMDESGAAITSESFELTAVDDTGNLYAFDENGYMMTGWVISSENRMVNGPEEWKIADYRFNSKGAASSGWKEISVFGGWKNENGKDKHFFYFDKETHKKQTGFLALNNSLYYLDDTGAMYSDMEITIDGVNYIIDEDGRVFEDEFTIIQQPKNGYGVVDAEVSIRIKALKADTYQWYYSTDGEGWSEVTDELADGYTTDTLVLNITDTTASYQYRCVVTDQEGTVLTSDSASIIITPVPVVYGTWHTVDGEWMFFDENGDYVCDAFAISNGKIYYLGSDGFLVVSEFVQYEDKTYYFDSTGAMLTDTEITIDDVTYVIDAVGVVSVKTEIPLRIVNQPFNIEGVNGETIEFHVNAEGAESYRWYYSADGSKWSALGSNYTGYADATLQVVVSDYRKSLQYRCVIRDAEGNTLTSDIVQILTPAPNLEIISQPVNVEGVNGETVEFHVEATGAESYRWYYSADGSKWSALGSNYIGYADATLQVVVSDYRKTLQYHCVVKDTKGNALTSNAVQIVEPAEPLEIIGQPVDVEGVNGETVEFYVEAVGAESYRWYYTADGSKWSAVGTNYAGFADATLQVVVNDYRKTLQYRCVVRDAQGNSLTSDTVRILEPAQPLEITGQPVNAEGVNGETVEFHVEATGAVGYRWYYSADGSKWSALGNNYTGNTEATLQVVVSDFRKTLQYRCVVIDAKGNTITSESVRIIEPADALKIVSQPVNAEGVNGETVEFHVEATGAESYRWYYNADGSKWSALGSNYAGNTEATLQVVVSDFRKTLQYRCTVSDAKGNTITSESVRIIEPADALKIVSQPVNAEGEIGETVEFHVEATGADSYRWYYSEEGTTWKAVGNNYTGYNAETLYVSVTAYRKTLQYRCVVKASDGSSVTSNTVKIMNP